ncbi:MAG: ParB N-terminal domain-containing protein [Desulfocapsaceae bacterium]
MKVAIERIRIDEDTRIRKDVGNLEPLQKSISQVGLINPVLIDEQGKLVAGYRRLRACRNLGWEEVEATVVTLEGDELQMLEVEVAENLHRKDFTPDEILATQKRREQIIESRRKKGWFERFWLWLKNLFGGQPAPAPAPAAAASAAPAAPSRPAEPAASAAQHAKKEQTEQKKDVPVKPESNDTDSAQPKQDAAEKPERVDTEDAQAKSVGRTTAPKSGEITERDGIRHIKWR